VREGKTASPESCSKKECLAKKKNLQTAHKAVVKCV
jgi:hypothetical protein